MKELLYGGLGSPLCSVQLSETWQGLESNYSLALMPFHPKEAEVWEALKVYIKVRIIIYFSADDGTCRLLVLQPWFKHEVSIKKWRVTVLLLSFSSFISESRRADHKLLEWPETNGDHLNLKTKTQKNKQKKPNRQSLSLFQVCSKSYSTT